MRLGLNSQTEKDLTRSAESSVGERVSQWLLRDTIFSQGNWAQYADINTLSTPN